MGLWEKVPNYDIRSWTNALVAAYMTPLFFPWGLVLHHHTGEIPMELVVSTEIGILGSLVESLGQSTDTPPDILTGHKELRALSMYYKESLQRPDR